MTYGFTINFQGVAEIHAKLSLKLHVGLIPAARNGFEYMRELHGSVYQQERIAEINACVKTGLVFQDGLNVFVTSGPMNGKCARGNVFPA